MSGVIQKPEPLPEFTSTEDARRYAIEFCRANPTWKPIFEIKDESLYSPLPWKKHPAWAKRYWRLKFGRIAAESAWDEFCNKKLYRFRSGFVGGSGNFYSDHRQIPFRDNICMVFEVGGRPSLYRHCFEFDRDGNGHATEVVDARKEFES